MNARTTHSPAAASRLPPAFFLRTATLPVAALLAAGLLTACSEPPASPPGDSAAVDAPAADSAPIFAVVYRCNDGTVFTVFPSGESAQADFTARQQQPQSQPPSAIAECEGSEAKSAAEAEQLRTAMATAPTAVHP